MDERWQTRLLPPALRRAGWDAVLALALAVAGTIETVAIDPGGPAGVAPAAVLTMTLVLAVRRTHPLATCLVVAGAVAGQTVVGVRMEQQLTPVLALIIAIYSLAAHTGTRRAVGGLAATLAISSVGVVAEHGISAGDLSWMAFVGGTTWVAGRALRHRLHRALEMERRAVLAEGERAAAERDREEQARRLVAEERARIARELHDIIAHGLSLIVVQAAAAEQVLDRDPQRVRGPLLAIQTTGREAMADVKRLVGVLRIDESDVGLAPQPSLGDIERLVAQVRDAGRPVDLVVEGAVRPLPTGLDLCAYRVLQEALTNSLKHAGPGTARVRVRYLPTDVELEVVDHGNGNGNGNGGHAGSPGHGLVGMRERVALYGGDLEVGRRAEGGFGVRARLPVAVEA